MSRTFRMSFVSAAVGLFARVAVAAQEERPKDEAPSVAEVVSALPPSTAGTGADPDLPELLARLVGLPVPKEPPPASRFHIALLPFVVANPLLGAGGGLAALGGFRTGGPETKFSRFEASGFFTTNHQIGLVLRSEVRLPRNEWILSGDFGGGRFPNPAFGLGGETLPSDRTIVSRQQVQLHETGYRLLLGHLYAGVGYFFDGFFDIVDERHAAGEETGFSSYPFGTEGRSVSSGLTLNLLWDGRDSPVRPSQGSYLLGRVRFDSPALGSDSNWKSVYLDGRTYFSIPGRQDVLALWAYAWSTFGATPYLLLPQIGADPEHRSGRGMVEGRFAAMDLLYGEVEYRAHLYRSLGAVAAVSLTAPSERQPGQGGIDFRTVHPGFAAGLRVLLDRSSGSNLVVDVGWAPSGELGFYLNGNETF